METTLLTKENAHRVTMVRRVDASESEPVAFLFRGKRHGYCSYSHLVGNPVGKKSSPWRISRTGRLWKWRIRVIWKTTSARRATPITSPRSHPKSGVKRTSPARKGTARGFAVYARTAAGTLHGKLQTLFLGNDCRQQPLCQRDDHGTWEI